MSTKVKGIIAAVLALLVAGFGWYAAYSDNDESTTPNTQAVVAATADVVTAVTAESEIVETDESKTDAKDVD